MMFNLFQSRSKVCVSIFLLIASLFSTACQKSVVPTSVSTNNLNNFPSKILWAWEREENLEFLNAEEFGVAFLAQTLEIKGDDVIIRSRRQPLRVNPETKLIAVTRIESAAKNSDNAPALSDSQRERIVDLILKTLTLKNVSAIQIDYDAVVSEREFYRRILTDVRTNLPTDTPLSMTALASFCIGDKWLKDLPVDEAIPMIFRMGADDKKVRSFLINGNDFPEPLCQKSYGISNDEPVRMNFDKSRRIYIFSDKAWTSNAVDTMYINNLNFRDDL